MVLLGIATIVIIVFLIVLIAIILDSNRYEEHKKEIETQNLEQVSKEAQQRKNEYKKSILSFLVTDPQLTANEAAERLGVSKKTATRYLDELSEKNIIKKIPSRMYGSHYTTVNPGRNPKLYLGQIITVSIDRPTGSIHPKFHFTYPVNYGFVPHTKAPDGEAIDAYVLGPTEPLTEFRGNCIALIHRINDDDDKLVITSTNTNLTDEEIKKLTNFQEQFFESVIIRD